MTQYGLLSSKSSHCLVLKVMDLTILHSISTDIFEWVTGGNERASGHNYSSLLESPAVLVARLSPRVYNIKKCLFSVSLFNTIIITRSTFRIIMNTSHRQLRCTCNNTANIEHEIKFPHGHSLLPPFIAMNAHMSRQPRLITKSLPSCAICCLASVPRWNEPSSCKRLCTSERTSHAACLAYILSNVHIKSCH